MVTGFSMIRAVQKVKGLTVLICLVALMPLVLGCFGSFPLTRAVYKINGSVPSGILRTVVMWLFVIFPVYGGAMFIDAIIPNLLEFWGPGTTAVAEISDGQGRRIVFGPGEDVDHAVLTISDGDEDIACVTFVRLSEWACEVRSKDGELLGMMERNDDLVVLKDTAGATVSTVDLAELVAARVATQ